MARVSLDLDDAKLKELKQLAKDVKATSVADVVRSSIELHKYLEKEKMQGNQVIIRNPARNVEKEVVLI